MIPEAKGQKIRYKFAFKKTFEPGTCKNTEKPPFLRKNNGRIWDGSGLQGHEMRGNPWYHWGLNPSNHNIIWLNSAITKIQY